VWDTKDYEIRALVKKDGQLVQDLPLQFSGKPSLFTGTFQAEEKGNYEIVVYAYNANNGNTGIDRVNIQIM
jgi:hypothetical protein